MGNNLENFRCEIRQEKPVLGFSCRGCELVDLVNHTNKRQGCRNRPEVCGS